MMFIYITCIMLIKDVLNLIEDVLNLIEYK